MNYDLEQIIQDCSDDPSLIFTFIKKGEFEIIKELIDANKINVNICDSVGNDLVTRLLKAKQYDLVLVLMKKRNWNVNHQNVEGDTFGHILAMDSSISSLKIVKALMKKKNYLPNIQNNKGQTVLDKAIHNHYIYTVFKILEDKRFNNISIFSFKSLYTLCIKNMSYGKYSKLDHLNVIVTNLEKKTLVPNMEVVIEKIHDNMEVIKGEILNNKSSVLENIINSSMEPMMV